jgi:serine protease
VPGNYTLSGTIRAANVNMVDSDTNDPAQSDYRVNDSPLQAQSLVSPVTLVGAVNLPGKGPSAGRHYASGDEQDWFKVSLKQGQVVELLVGEADGNDADLCVASADASTVGCSVSTTERECVRVTEDGDYYIAVDEFSKSSVYNLRIAAPGLAAACENTVAPASAFVPNQLLAMPKVRAGRAGAGTQAAGQGHRRQALSTLGRAGLQVDEAAAGDAVPIDLIRLPAPAAARAQALQQLRAGPDAEQMRRRLSAGAGSGAPIHPVVEALQLFRLAKTIRSTGAYRSVEPNWIMQTQGALVGSFPASDWHYPSQRWHYEQIRLPEAIQYIAGLAPPAKRPVVAVIDTGVMLDHPDLAGQLVPGRSFLSAAAPGDGDGPGGDEGARKAEDGFHGTHVAGTIGASSFDTGPNSYGAGVAPMARIMPLRVFPAGRGASSLDILEALKYAAGLSNRTGFVPQTRADVVNLSLGSTRSCPAAYQTVLDAVRAAGVLVVAAAGNDADNRSGVTRPIMSPANCNGVFAVTATDALRGIAPYSNTGDQAAVAAPGGDTSVSTTGLGVPDGVFSTLGAFNSQRARVPDFGALQGTSMAAPHVAGVLALMRYVNPALTPDQVLGSLQAGALTDEAGAPGKDTVFGWGVINARKAVEAAHRLAQGSNAGPAPTQVVATPSSADFGSQRSDVSIMLRGSSGVSNERVSRVTSTDAFLVARPVAVDDLGHGEYRLTLDRASLPSTTRSYASTLRVEFEGGRALTIPVSYSVIAASSGFATSQVGALYVLLVDPDSGDVEKTVLATYANGGYTWTASGYTKPRVVVIAGTDLDYDDLVCQVGEVCGGYPVLTTNEGMTLGLTADRSDLSFVVSPLGGGMKAASVAGPKPFMRQRSRR